MTPLSPLKMTAALTGALLLLGACATEPTGPASGTVAPPQSGAAPASGGALPPPSSGDSPAGGRLPVVSSELAPAPAAEGTRETPKAETSGEAVILKGPDGTTWAARSVKDEDAYRDDIDDCFRYASAQTRNDARILDDRNAGIDTLTSQSRYSPLRQRVDEFDLRNRRAALMSSCMESKGYARTDTVLPRLEF